MNFKKLRQVLSLCWRCVSLTSGVAKVAGTSEESNGPASGMIEALAAENAASQVELTGVVLAPGFDDKNPVIEHRQGTTFTYTGIGIPLEAVVSDNISVARVAALVQQAGSGNWNEVSLHLHEGNYRSGTYRGQIPREMVKYPYLDYKIVAEDNSGNRTETIPCRVEVSFGLQPDWIEDFSEEPFFWVWDGDWEG